MKSERASSFLGGPAYHRRRHRFHPWVGKIPGGGNGNPLKYPCLENSMVRWVHGVAESQTRLKWLSMDTRMVKRIQNYVKKEKNSEGKIIQHAIFFKGSWCKKLNNFYEHLMIYILVCVFPAVFRIIKVYFSAMYRSDRFLFLQKASF